MAQIGDAEQVVLHGYWRDEDGIAVDGDITLSPVKLTGQSGATPNLKDLTSFTHIRTKVRVGTPDPTTGYYAVLALASNDPDVDAYGGRQVTFAGYDPFIIQVPYNAPQVTVDTKLNAQIPSLTIGATVRALWLIDAPDGSTPPTPSNAYWTADQTASVIDQYTWSPQGTWSSATAYVLRDVVLYSGSSYVAVGASTNVTPGSDDTKWQLIAQGGGGSYTDELAQDAAAALFTGGTHSGISFTYNDSANTITATVTGGGGYTDEQAQDAMAALFAAGTQSGITIAYNDAGNAISATVSAQTWSQITGKPTFAAVATSGSASDITTGTLPDGVIPAGIARDSEVATAVANLVNSAPGTLDTLGEIATALQADESAAAALTTTVGGKLAKASNLSDLPSAATARSNLGAAAGFTQSATKTGTYTAADNEIVPIDTTGGTFTVTGPTSGAPFGFRWKAGTAAPTIAAPSGYTISGNASVTPGLPPSGASGELVLYQAFGADYQPVGGMKPQSALDARFVKAATGGFSAYVAASTPSGAATGDVWIPTTPVALSDLGGQPLDSDLTTIAGLTATTDSFLQAKSGAWTTRTIAQVRADLAVEMGIPNPVDYGIIGWSSDPVGGMGGASTTTSGTMWVTRVIAAEAGTVGTILAYVNVAGATPTAGECAAVLYNSTGTQVGITGDIGSQLTSIGMKGLTLTAGVTANAGDIFYVGVLSTATTQPSWARASLVATPSALGTVAMPASRYGQYPTGSLTAPPSSITPGSLTPNGTAAFWAAIKA